MLYNMRTAATLMGYAWLLASGLMLALWAWHVRIRNAAGKLLTFRGKPSATVGSYRARVVFPKAGRYQLGVYDGFPVAECARVHTFKSVLIVAV